MDSDKLITDSVVLKKHLLGQLFSVKVGSPLEKTTYVAPSQVISRVKRIRWLAKKILGEYKPQRERGLFAKKPFKKGDYIGNYDGIIVDMSYLTQMNETTDYVIWPGHGLEIGVLGENLLRWSNHQPEGEANMLQVGLSFYAAADIKSGDEMTWPYFDGDWDQPITHPLNRDDGPL